ncbi:hypothetical protein C8R44DRAFT_740817 [Mycena epipterygia]|nr:hypothetical protein C8R44DRAFT_740817 [Mycena epipterygia]
MSRSLGRCSPTVPAMEDDDHHISSYSATPCLIELKGYSENKVKLEALTICSKDSVVNSELTWMVVFGRRETAGITLVRDPLLVLRFNESLPPLSTVVLTYNTELTMDRDVHAKDIELMPDLQPLKNNAEPAQLDRMMDEDEPNVGEAHSDDEGTRSDSAVNIVNYPSLMYA